jgi:nicotinate-nucleotide adenylyltransferase
MNLALYGGTFDPIHRGHLAIARAAQKRFRLDRVLFMPADIPPHKQRAPVSAFEHRYAMVALATAGEKDFVPSLLDAPRHGPNYSIDTVRRVRREQPKTRLFFLIGIDAFRDLATWREPEALLKEVEFIVVSRPGFDLQDIVEALPETLRQKAKAQGALAEGSLSLRGIKIHMLDGVAEDVSSTAVRQDVAQGKPIGKMVAPTVAEYIDRVGLYRGEGVRSSE